MHKIALIGRPNVGKSTLFNRLIKKRRSIIDPTPGVTRDLINENVIINGIEFQITDTGGLTDEKIELNDFVQKKALEAIASVDLILFLVEAGIPLPIESEYAGLIRKSGKSVIVVMNKSDSPEKDIFGSDYYGFGFGNPVPISAVHNRNIDDLIDLIFEKLSIEPLTSNHSRLSDTFEGIKLAIVGKPNVGKSSLLNKIAKKERSIVSDIAGTTRDVVDEIVEFEGINIWILDTAGIRRKNKVNEDIEYYSVNRAIRTIEDADIIVLVLDSYAELSEQDKKIADLAVKNGKGLIIALNKWDKLQIEEKNLDTKKDRLLFKFPRAEYIPIIKLSALTGEGVLTLLKKVIVLNDELGKRIDTPALNDFIQNVIKKYSPSSRKGVLKIAYGTQVSVKPVEFIFFINNKNLLTENYKNYIINNIRKQFGYNGVPIKVNFKEK